MIARFLNNDGTTNREMVLSRVYEVIRIPKPYDPRDSLNEPEYDQWNYSQELTDRVDNRYLVYLEA